MALLEQHSPSSPFFHNLRRFTVPLPYCPYHGMPLQGNPAATANAIQNCVTITCHSFLFLACSFASLTSILHHSGLSLPYIYPISHLLLSIELQPRTFKDPKTRVWGEVTLPATPLLCCLWGNLYRRGYTQSPRPVPFSRLIRHADNTLVLFFLHARNHRAVLKWKDRLVLKL